ncbi:MAG: hypothetical protein CM15mP130_0610 [Verrucomicrobiota bacterium]|nr:MAG: hypothetical protein CM15mP130_0610 [Verrucomicrobiota bacterium]
MAWLPLSPSALGFRMIRVLWLPAEKGSCFYRYRYVPQDDSHDRSKRPQWYCRSVRVGREGIKHVTNLGVDKGYTGIICLYGFQAGDFIQSIMRIGQL